MTEYWLSLYEDPTFEKQLQTVVDDLMDMYEQFHAYVRYKLSKIYKIPKRQPIPMHLLGNIMGQMWDEVMKRN